MLTQNGVVRDVVSRDVGAGGVSIIKEGIANIVINEDDVEMDLIMAGVVVEAAIVLDLVVDNVTVEVVFVDDLAMDVVVEDAYRILSSMDGDRRGAADKVAVEDGRYRMRCSGCGFCCSGCATRSKGILP